MPFAFLALILGAAALIPLLDGGSDASESDEDGDTLPPEDPTPPESTTETEIQITRPDGVEIVTLQADETELDKNLSLNLGPGDTSVVVDPDGQTNVTVRGNVDTETFEIGRGDSVYPDDQFSSAPDDITLVISETAFEEQVAKTPGNETSVSPQELRETDDYNGLVEARSQNYGTILLSDDQDSLLIEIDPDIEGNLHVFEHVWQQDGEQYNAQQTSRFYIITSPEIVELEPDMFFVDAGGTGSAVTLNSDFSDTISQDIQIVAEVALGEAFTSYDSELDDYVTGGDLNMTPDITTSRPVTSTLRLDNGEF